MHIKHSRYIDCYYKAGFNLCWPVYILLTILLHIVQWINFTWNSNKLIVTVMSILMIRILLLNNVHIFKTQPKIM